MYSETLGSETKFGRSRHPNDSTNRVGQRRLRLSTNCGRQAGGRGVLADREPLHASFASRPDQRVSRLAAPRTPHQEGETMMATGTDDSGSESVAPNLAQKPESRGEALTTAASSSDANWPAEHLPPETRKPGKNRGSEHVREFVIASTRVPKVGVEPTRPLRTRDFESRASAIPPLRLVEAATS